MEALAAELRRAIDLLCIEYYYEKQTDVVDKGQKLAPQIQQFITVFLKGNVFGIEESEYQTLLNYALQVLQDYMQALEQRDMVLMLDVLDYGLRDLLYIFMDDDSGDENDE